MEYLSSNSRKLPLIKEHIPLKQGLRRLIFFPAYENDSIKEHIPLKQGLRQTTLSSATPSWSDKRTYSTKTRIKTKPSCPVSAFCHWIKEHIPLKQGLRLPFC